MADLKTNGYIPYRNIIDHLDIQAGDIVYVASNTVKLSFLSKKNEGSFDADKFIESIQKKIGEQGTLVFPAFNFELKNKDAFDIRRTAPITGTLSLAAFARTDFKRTRHPLHSFLAWGKYSDELASMNNVSSFEENSPFAFVHGKNAKLLAIDLDFQHSYTFAHYAEEKEKVPYRIWRNYTINYTDADGITQKRNYLLYAKKAGYINDVNPLYEDLKRENRVKESSINQIMFRIIPLDAALSAAVKDIRTNHGKKLYYFSFSALIKAFIKKIL